MIKANLKRGDLLLPGIYMVQNGNKIVGLVLDVDGDQVRVFLNNGKDCWYDQKTITDLFQPVGYGNARSSRHA